jgi:hypothetical protein
MVTYAPSVESSIRGVPPTHPRNGAAVWLAVGAVHLAAVLWLFGGALWSGRLLYFRDLAAYYAPQLAVVAQGLRQGTWPLWNPLANAGEPSLPSYPVDLALLLSFGPRAPLGIGAALHLFLGLAGALLLARRLGMGPWGALATSAAYGLGGFALSTANLLQLFEAAAWAPFVLWALLLATERPTGRRLAGLATLGALQASTLGAEIVVQTLALGVVLAGPRLLARRRLARLAGAGLVAFLLAAPAVLGTAALVRGTARSHGFRVAEALSYSVHPVVLLEAVLPQWLGNPHAFSDADLWGRAYFPEGYPYLISIYLGPAVFLLALQARDRRLWLVALAGALLALGRFGPLGWLPAPVALPFRGPQKLLFLTHTAIALLAGFGLERRVREPPRGARRALLLLPGLALAALVLALRVDPLAVRAVGAAIVGPLADPRGLVAVTSLWPSAWLPTAALTVLVGIVLARGGRWACVAGPLVVLDLLLVNGGLNPLAPSSFYDLRADTRQLVERAGAGQGPAGPRWYSYGVANTPGLRFEPVMRQAPSDVWLYYLDRQSLLPLSPALDGLPGAFDIDRTGWAPAGSTLPVGEATPDRFAAQCRRLRLAGVRWVLSFRPLPAGLAALRSTAKLPEIVEPLGLYELEEPLPRAFFVPAGEVEPDLERRARRLEADAFDPAETVLLEAVPPSGPGGRAADGTPRAVAYEAVDPHTVRLAVRTPPGFVVVLDGWDPGWSAEDETGPVPLLRANGRYRAIPTPGGARVFTMRYRPSWRFPALALTALGALVAAVLALRR